MGFSVSTIPLETNTGYLSSTHFSYTKFSEWFNKVKNVFQDNDNYSEMRSDRLEATFRSGQSFATVVFSDNGFGMDTGISVRFKAENGDNDQTVVYPLLTRNEGESLDDLTVRWITAMHASIGSVLRSLKVRVLWFYYPFDSFPVASVTPPELFPPTT